MDSEYIDEKEKSYQAVFHSQYLACAIVDKNGMVRKITRAMLERFALPTESLKQKSLMDCLHSIELEEYLRYHIASGEDCSTRLIAFRGTKNMILWNKVEITTMHMKDFSKEYLFVFSDCTESYQAQMILESSLTLSSELFLFFDTKDCLLQCSEEAVRIFGFPNRFETFGMHYTTFFHECIAKELLNELFSTLAEGKSFERNIPIRYKGSNEVYELQAFNVMVKSVKTGTALCFHKKPFMGLDFFMEEPASYEQEVQSVFERKEEKLQIQYTEEDAIELVNKLKELLTSYDYTASVELIDYMMTRVNEKEVGMLEQLEREVLAFRYEYAIHLIDEYLKKET